MKRLLVLGFVLFAAGFAPAPFPRSPQRAETTDTDLTLLQGDWEVIRLNRRERDRDLDRLSIRVDGTRLTLAQGGEVVTDCQFTLDAQRRPRSVRIVPKKDHGQPFSSLYTVDESTFILCFWADGNPEADRFPKALAPGADLTYLVCKRTTR